MTPDRGSLTIPRSTGWRAGLIWGIAASSALAMALGHYLNPDALIVEAIVTGVVLSFAIVGAVLVTRVPSNPLGWLLFVSGPGLAWAVVGVTYGTRSGLECGGCLPASAPVALLANVVFIPLLGVIGVYIPLLFPDGHLPSSRWRPVAWLGVASIVVFAAATAMTPGPISDGIAIENPIGLAGLGPVLAAIGSGAVASLMILMIVALTSVIWRYRHAGPVQRQQLRWFGYAALVMVSFVIFGLLAPWESGWVLMFAGFGALPLATGVAVLRYRLYDLDRLVSRTIAYAVVTGGLFLAYLAINLSLTTVFSSWAREDSVVVAASTLAVAALFTPLRRRVQRVVDRRFDRARYDAERTATAFAESLRNQVDLPSLVRELDTTVRGAILPSRVGVWLRVVDR